MKYIATISFFFLWISGFTQNEYLVYQVRGGVNLLNKGGQQPVKVGQLLSKSTVLRIDKQAALVLLCRNYQPIKLQNSVRIGLDSISYKCRQKVSDETSLFFKYIWEELTHPHGSPETDRRKFMKNVGGASRGCPGIAIDGIFDTIQYFRKNFSINWKRTLPEGDLTLALFDRESGGGLIHEFRVRENRLPVDSLVRYAGGRDVLYWNLRIDGSEDCDRHYLRIWNEPEFRALLKSMENSVDALNEAERFFLRGFLLEELHFPGEAGYQYSQATKRMPGVARYKAAWKQMQAIKAGN